MSHSTANFASLAHSTIPQDPQAVAQSSQRPQPQNLQLMSVEQELHTTSLQSSHCRLYYFGLVNGVWRGKV